MPSKIRVRHRLERNRYNSGLNRPFEPHGNASKLRENAAVDCGWGRLLFGQTFTDLRHLADCRTTGAFEPPLSVVPGRYLAVVSRGPEYDYIKQLIDVAAGESVTVRGVIHRAVDSSGRRLARRRNPSRGVKRNSWPAAMRPWEPGGG